MKKKLLLTLLILLMATPVFAQRRGALTNVYASWVSIGATGDTTITLPYKSRDLWIHNGSAVDICINPIGSGFDSSSPNECYSSSNSFTFQLNGTDDVYFSDFVTESIDIRSAAGSVASPVSVVVTY